jgi:hypothetical protein
MDFFYYYKTKMSQYTSKCVGSCILKLISKTGHDYLTTEYTNIQDIPVTTIE